MRKDLGWWSHYSLSISISISLLYIFLYVDIPSPWYAPYVIWLFYLTCLYLSITCILLYVLCFHIIYCRCRKNIFIFVLSLLLFILLDCGLILYFPTPTPIGLNEISFSVCCVLKWTYCVNMYKCVCVCFGIFMDMANGTDNTRFGVTTNYREIMRCDWSPMSTGFIILIKTCIKTRFGTRDGFGNLVMRGEGVRHPTTSVHKRLPPSMCSCVCLINQAEMLDYY